jgi:hypothetical protein
VRPGWQVTDEMVEAFRKYLIAERVRMDEPAFKADEAFIRAMIHFEVDIDLFGAEEARRHLSSADPQVQMALGGSLRRGRQAAGSTAGTLNHPSPISSAPDSPCRIR